MVSSNKTDVQTVDTLNIGSEEILREARWPLVLQGPEELNIDKYCYGSMPILLFVVRSEAAWKYTFCHYRVFFVVFSNGRGFKHDQKTGSLQTSVRSSEDIFLNFHHQEHAAIFKTHSLENGSQICAV